MNSPIGTLEDTNSSDTTDRNGSFMVSFHDAPQIVDSVGTGNQFFLSFATLTTLRTFKN